MDSKQKLRLGAKSWIIVYIVAALVFAIIMLWIATTKIRRGPVKMYDNSNPLEIVEGFNDESFSFPLHISA